MNRLMDETQKKRALFRLAARKLSLAEKLRQAYSLGYDQGSEQQMQMRIRDAQEARRDREGLHIFGRR